MDNKLILAINKAYEIDVLAIIYVRDHPESKLSEIATFSGKHVANVQKRLKKMNDYNVIVRENNGYYIHDEWEANLIKWMELEGRI